MIPLHLDTETYCETPITYGTHKYAEKVEVIMWQWAIGDGEVHVEEELSVELTRALLDPQYEVVIQNSSFDRTVIRHYAGIDIPVSRIFDTQVCALAHSLPGGLAELCKLFNLPSDIAKDKDGKRLIQMFCKPQIRKGKEPQRFTKHTHPENWGRFLSYGATDIKAMRAIYNLLPRWNYKGEHRRVWEADQEMNDRGFRIDVDLANAAIAACKDAKEETDSEVLEMTNGEVTSTNRRDQLLEHILSEYGIAIKDLTSSRVQTLVNDPDTPPDLANLLALRLDASKTSVAKYAKVLKCISSDERLRGASQFCGGSRTGRWNGKLFQPLNLPRPQYSNEELERHIDSLKSEEGLPPSESPMDVCSSLLRGLIIPSKGKKFLIADWSNIEGRVLAWLAGEEWKLDAFRAYDRGDGEDLYKIAYSKMFRIPASSVDKQQRQIGKVEELSRGFQGGVGASVRFCTAMGIDIPSLAELAYPFIPKEVLAKSENFMQWIKKGKSSLHGLSEKEFLVLNSFKIMWRQSHPLIVRYWQELEDTCKSAISNPGETFTCFRHKVRRDGEWLRVSKPNGCYVCYPFPRIEDGKVTYYGRNQFTHKLERISTYGGKLVENMTQSVACDILKDFVLVLKDTEDFKTVLTVHDEIIVEVPDEVKFHSGMLTHWMSIPPEWCEGIPLDAKGFECYRYCKPD